MTGPHQFVREDILKLSAYPVASAAGMVKLDAMENPYRLPDALREEVARAVANAEINRYPDPSASTLKARLRDVMRIPPASEILLGNGSDEIIAIVTQALARPGAVILAPEPTFVMYRMNAALSGARFVGVPLKADFSLDMPVLLARIKALQPALVWLAYPNNPTGNLFQVDEIEAVIGATPGLVVVDEAYNVFAARTFLDRLPEFANLMVMRTVSKIGLAGIRLGYAAAGADWIREFDKVRPPYNVSVLAQVVAERVLAHMPVFDEQAAMIKNERSRMIDALAGLPGVTSFATEANFVLIRVPDAQALNDHLKHRKILVRNFHGSHPLLANCLRLTVGTPGENVLLLETLAEAL
ncbi:MAG: histidinol-phosphate transaminase [Betaproteobacteria bacterium]|nr:histidinol-phosphate transaminase [Betaproteobacteria bacterium]